MTAIIVCAECVYAYWADRTPACKRNLCALAAATGTAKTPKAVECEASQSGPKGNAQPLSPNSFEEQ